MHPAMVLVAFTLAALVTYVVVLAALVATSALSHDDRDDFGTSSTTMPGDPHYCGESGATTATEHAAPWMPAWLTEPRSIPSKAPRPRFPTTTMPASRDVATSVSSGGQSSTRTVTVSVG